MDQQALHQSVEATLKQHDCDIGAAECHGVLCGMLCSANPFSATEWLTHTMGYQHDTDLSTLGASEPLQQLYQQTHNELVSQDFSFSILIPSDDYSCLLYTSPSPRDPD